MGLDNGLSKQHKLCKEDIYDSTGYKSSTGKQMVRLVILAHHFGRKGRHEDPRAIELLESTNKGPGFSAAALLKELEGICKAKTVRAARLPDFFVITYPFHYRT